MMVWALLGVVAWMIVDDGEKAMVMMHAQPVAAAGGGIVPPVWLEGQLASW
jgi:hypothetical protein